MVKVGDKVFVEIINYGHSHFYVTTVKRLTKTLIITKHGGRFKKWGCKYDNDSSIGVENCGKYCASNYIYTIDNKRIIQKHIEQCYEELEEKIVERIHKEIAKKDFTYKYNLYHELTKEAENG